MLLDYVWNVMAHTQKPDCLSPKRTSPFKSAGASVQSTTGSRCVRIGGSNAGYTMFRGSVKGTGYPLHSPVSPSLPLPCVTVCHHISTGVYTLLSFITVAWGGGQGRFGEIRSYPQWEYWVEVFQRRHSLHQFVPKEIYFTDFWWFIGGKRAMLSIRFTLLTFTVAHVKWKR